LSGRILAALACGALTAAPVSAQQGLSDWQSTPTSNDSAPAANWTSPPGSYLPNKSSAKNASGKTSAPPLRTDDFSGDFSSKSQGLSGWQGGGSANSSGGGSSGLSGWQGGGSANSSGGGSSGLSGWQGGGSSSSSGGGSSGLSGWQGGGSSNSSSGDSAGLSGWQGGGGSGAGATLSDVLQQEQSMGNNAGQLQGGVERDRTINNSANTMGGGMPDMNGMGNAMGGMGQGASPNPMGANPMGAMPGGMGGMGGALGGMGGAAGLMEVLSNIMPKRPTPGTVQGGVNHSYFGTRSRGPNVLTGVPKTVNRAVNRNLKRGINTAAARATNMGLRRLRF